MKELKLSSAITVRELQNKYNMRNTEAIHVLAKGCFRTDVFKFSFYNRIVDLWNGLSVVIGVIDQLSLFSKRVNQYYIS